MKFWLTHLKMLFTRRKKSYCHEYLLLVVLPVKWVAAYFNAKKANCCSAEC